MPCVTVGPYHPLNGYPSVLTMETLFSHRLFLTVVYSKS